MNADLDLLKRFGQIAGIAGISVGVLLVVFRDIIRKEIFPRLTKAQGFRVLTLIIISVWSVALVGVGAWVLIELKRTGDGPPVWEPVGVRHEESAGVVQDVLQQDGVKIQLQELEVREVAPSDYEYRWHRGNQQRVYRVTKDGVGAWSVQRTE
jgi:hypothetical protein